MSGQPPEGVLDFEALKRYFLRRLDQMRLHYDRGPLSYEGDTDYDRQVLQLQAEAQQYWKRRYGHMPTPGQLMNAFHAAEFERARRHRLARQGFWAKLRRWLDL